MQIAFNSYNKWHTGDRMQGIPDRSTITRWKGQAFDPQRRQLKDQAGQCPEISVFLGGAEFAITYKDLPWRQKPEGQGERDTILWPLGLAEQDHRCDPKEVERVAAQCHNCNGIARMARKVNAKVAVWNECHCCQMWPIC